MKIEICNAHVIDPANRVDGVNNVYIADKKIAAVGAAPPGWKADKTYFLSRWRYATLAGRYDDLRFR